jgi:drug/metabolite transporter (DMT)-like permease
LPDNADKRSHWRLYTLITLMTLFWSLNFIVAKWVLREIPPLFASGMRTALAGCLMLPLYFWNTRHNGGAPWTWKQVPMLISLGLLGVGLNQIFFILGMSRTSVGHAALLIALTPILVLLLAAAVRQEALTAGRLAGMFIALAGVAVLHLSSQEAAGATLTGDLFMFLAAATFAIFTVRGKRETLNLDTITLNTFAYVGSGCALLPVTLWYSLRFPVESVTPAAWAGVVYMALFPSILCYTIYYYALTHISASRVAAFSYLQPLLALLLAILLLGEQPTRTLMAGGALVLAGVFVAERM